MYHALKRNCLNNKRRIYNKQLIWVEINETHLRHNLAILAAQSGGLESICAVIKGNAYGHGLEEMGRLLAGNGVKRFAVYHTEEAIFLRSVIGKGIQILILGPASIDSVEDMVRNELECMVMNLADIEVLDAAVPDDYYLKIHLKLDTGMNRYGIRFDQADAIIPLMNKVQRLKLAGVASHFGNATVKNDSITNDQITCFNKLVARMPFAKWVATYEKHFCNTAGLFNYPKAHFDFSRTGIGIMGYHPSRELYDSSKVEEQLMLKPVLSFKTRVVSIKSMLPGEYAGYDLGYKSDKQKQIAILPIGYSDGFPFGHSGNGSYVLIKGKRASVLGRVNMNALIIDISNISGVQIGDVATLLGEDGADSISVWNWLDWGTVHLYESLTKLRSSLPKLITA
jgi:alanine racemase